MQTIGSRAQVWHGTAKKTSGGLTKKDLFQDKYGNLKSKKASKKAKSMKNLRKAGWTFKKGQFGAIKIEDSKKKTGSKKRGSKKRGSKKRGSKKRGSRSRSRSRSR